MMELSVITNALQLLLICAYFALLTIATILNNLYRYLHVVLVKLKTVINGVLDIITASLYNLYAQTN